MTIKEEYFRQITPPAGGPIVRLESYGEHHMGAEHICIKLDRRFAEKTAFHTTNGDAVFSEDGTYLLLHDAGLILLLNYRDGAIHHLPRPNDLYFAGIVFRDSNIVVEQRDQKGQKAESKTFSISEAERRWKKGLGPASTGLFPSVYVPTYERLVGEGMTP